MDMHYVVIDDPVPEAREAYYSEDFVYVPGVGHAYDLTRDYGGGIEEVSKND